MVEGHSVHRVATFHRQRLVGKAFRATSPNGRFTAGAQAIDGRTFRRIEAVGKNLFAFFGNDDDGGGDVVVHIHFGMAGAWAVYEDGREDVPEPSKTNRLRLQGHGITADLSAMTVQHGGMELYQNKRSQLGHDPLREDADPDVLWSRVQASKKSIGALIMDQSYFTGPGNIYRAEILFKAGVHPDVPGNLLQRAQFDAIWAHTVALLQRGFVTGSILTVDPGEARALGKPTLRRYIYNASRCPRCQTAIQTWEIANRTCYACPTCQPPVGCSIPSSPLGDDKKEPHVPFHSHCAPESAHVRLEETGPERLTVAELKDQLLQRKVAIPKGARKTALVELLVAALQKPMSSSTKPEPPLSLTSSEVAAAEKSTANESLAVEHIAELSPAQARRARRQAAVTPDGPPKSRSQKCKRRRTSSKAAAVVTPPQKTSKHQRKGGVAHRIL